MKVLLLTSIALLCTIASAHVTMFPTTATVGVKSIVYAQVPHSCDGAPNTIGVSVRIPTNLTAQPISQGGYNLTRTYRYLSNGKQQLDYVTWMSTTGGFPTWQIGLFGIMVTFPAAYFNAGRKVWFQTIQWCDGVGTQAYSNWTLVTTPQTIDDLDLQLAALGETSPSVTVNAATTLTTYINTTTYVMEDNDDWTTDSTLSVIAIILAALACLALLYGFINRPAKKTSKKAPAAAPAAVTSPTAQPAGTTFVAANVA